jgi:hypothetical protein
MQKIKCPEKVTAEEVLECVVEKRTLLNNIMLRNAKLEYAHSKQKLPSSWCLSKGDNGSERSRKKKKNATN